MSSTGINAIARQETKMAIPILNIWRNYFLDNRNEGLGSSYERIVLNIKLTELLKRYNISSALEAPVFGFTGLSGINSMHLAKYDIPVYLIDNHQDRLEMIKQVWDEVKLPAEFIYQRAFTPLHFPDNSLDFAWNFSAMWFLEDMHTFLREMTRVISKVIMICVPNRSGLGYMTQKLISSTDVRKHLREDFIVPRNIIKSMRKFGWRLREKDYIDCPPWPDIGMAKEEFLKIFGLYMPTSRHKNGPPFHSIMDYYSGKDTHFKQKMLKYIGFENNAPRALKFFWAHHKFLIFTPR